jgi:hypothetical protein
MERFNKRFNELTDKFLKTLESFTPTVFAYDPAKAQPDMEFGSMADPADIRLRIGGGTERGVNYVSVVTDPAYALKTEIWLIGPDLNALSSGAPYGRVTLVKMDDTDFTSRQLYNYLVDLTLVKQKVRPTGFNVDYIEAARFERASVSGKELDRGLRFANIGASYIRKFLEKDRVTAVTEIFITDPAYDFDAAEALKQKENGQFLAVRANTLRPGNFR